MCAEDNAIFQRTEQNAGVAHKKANTQLDPSVTRSDFVSRTKATPKKVYVMATSTRM